MRDHLVGIGRRRRQLADLRAGEERRGAHLHRDVGDPPPLGDHRLGDLAGEAATCGVEVGAVGEVALERLLPAAAPGDVRLVDDRRVAAAQAGQLEVGADRRAEAAGQLVVVGRRQLGDRPDAGSARRAAVRAPMPHRAVTGRSPIVGNHVVRGEPGDAAGLGEPGRRLRLQLGLADAHRAASARSPRATRVLHRLGPAPPGRRCGRPTNASSQPHTSTTTGNERSASITRADAAS